MNKNYWAIAFALVVVFICTGIGYKIGYSAKHPPKYVYVRYNDINTNVFKTLQEIGNGLTKEEQDLFYDKLKQKKVR